MDKKNFDITIVGGGMVGASLALSLAATPWRIALIDNSATKEDPRLIALNYNSFALLEKLGVWTSLVTHAAAINEIHVSHRGHFGKTSLTASELQLPTLGYVVPAKYINAALYDKLRDQQNIKLIRPATLTDLHEDSDHIDFKMDAEDKTYSTKWLVGADGTFSTVRQLLNIPFKKTEYQQSALVTTTTLNRSHKNIAYERFLKTGAIAMLPLAGEQAATIWTDTNEKISQLMQLTHEDFLQELQKYFGYRLGKLKQIGQRYIFPLQLIQAEQQIKRKCILIGNAAHTLHPIAAQGLNLALHEVIELAEFFGKNPVEENKILSFTVEKQKNSLRLSHHLSWLFTQDFFIINKARQIGLIGLDLFNPFKKWFADIAMGGVK